MLTSNPLRDKIRANRPVIGTWNTLGSPLLTETLARGGFDFVIVDFEHGPFDLSRTSDYVKSCQAHDCSPIVRVPANEPWMILQALDQGAQGIMVPHIDASSDAERLVKAARYHPDGDRGYSPYTAAGGFSNDGNDAYSKKANSLILTSIIIESRKSLDNLDAILRIPGIDIVYFGAYDLSQALGVPGDVRNKKVLDAISAGLRKTSDAGKCGGAFVAKSRDDVTWLLDLGARFITYGVDSDLIYRQVRDITDWFPTAVKTAA